MSLNITPVSQCLDKKLKFLGYEIPDLLLILSFLSALNFILSSVPMKLIVAWVPTFILAAILRIGKHGKPDNYLLHKARFMIQPKVIRAFPDCNDFNELPKFLRKA